MDLVRDVTWQGSQSDVTDKISVRNLQVTANAGVDAWGRQRAQPTSLSYTLSLAKPPESAAETDSLDNSTVHYGKLSKNIQAAVDKAGSQWLSTSKLAERIHEVALSTADPTPLAALEVEVFYPKGSSLGDGAGFKCSKSFQIQTMSRVLYLKDVRIPCLIGVNSNERQAKQPAIVNVWIDSLPEGRSDDYVKLEQVVGDAISSSSFETLESLAAMVVDELRSKFFTTEDEAANIRLRVEKPLAVPFADAPAIEVYRSAKGRT